ncbi:MAG: helix-turn-helix domain-containing protein [Acidimicrobiia bacterium]
MARGVITEERLILAAERLYADHGLDAVSLRQIADAAGQKNHAVVQYHFGGKAGLLRAIVRYRTGVSYELREEALDELERTGRQHDVRGLLEAAIVPLLKSQPPGSNYLRFIVALQPAALADAWQQIDIEHGSSGNRINRYLDETLGHIPLAMRQARMGRAFDMVLRALADHFGDGSKSQVPRLPDDLFVEELVLSGAAVLEAPLPPRSAQRLRRRPHAGS